MAAVAHHGLSTQPRSLETTVQHQQRAQDVFHTDVHTSKRAAGTWPDQIHDLVWVDMERGPPPVKPKPT